MDRLGLRRRLRRLLALGAVSIVLAYLGPMVIRARPRPGAYRAAANAEKMKAALEAKLASDETGQAEQLRREGRLSEAEQLAGEAEGHRQKEALYRRNAQELRGRWW